MTNRAKVLLCAQGVVADLDACIEVAGECAPNAVPRLQLLRQLALRELDVLTKGLE